MSAEADSTATVRTIRAAKGRGTRSRSSDVTGVDKRNVRRTAKANGTTSSLPKYSARITTEVVMTGTRDFFVVRSELDKVGTGTQFYRQ
jgi:hypothetical protein